MQTFIKKYNPYIGEKMFPTLIALHYLIQRKPVKYMFSPNLSAADFSELYNLHLLFAVDSDVVVVVIDVVVGIFVCACPDVICPFRAIRMAFLNQCFSYGRPPGPLSNVGVIEKHESIYTETLDRHSLFYCICMYSNELTIQISIQTTI